MKVLLHASLVCAVVAAPAACTGSGSPASPAPLLPASRPAPRQGAVGNVVVYTFTTLDDPSEPSFNRLLGINNLARVVGYYGSGSPSEPSVGYQVFPPYAQKNYQRVAYPQAVDTEVTSVNNKKAVAGFYVTAHGNTISFLYTQGIWFTYNDPHAHGAGAVTEILGINDAALAVGFYSAGSKLGSFELNLTTGRFGALHPPGTGAVVTGINGHGDVVGYTTQSGTVVGFIRKNGTYTTFSYPYAVSTKFLSVAAHDYVVGSYVDSAGGTHGFLLVSPLFKRGTTWETVDDPNGIGTTVATGVNIHEDIVGYYVDTLGVTHGFLATPTVKR